MFPEDIEAYLRPILKGEVRLAEPLKLHTTWSIGGPAEVMILPQSLEDITATISFAHQNEIPYYVIGNGSNLLVADEGTPGIVIKLAHQLKRIRVEGNNIIAEAGAMLPQLAQIAAKHSLAGLEFAAGIPASVGGAAVMNASAHGKDMAEVVKEAKVITEAGELLTLRTADLGYSYRASKIQDNGYIVVEVTLGCEPGDSQTIREKTKRNLQVRKNCQPLNFPNAGSVFKNPPGDAAGRLIELVGGKGMRVGDAEVAAKHANFIINLGEAKARDVIKLIEQIKSLVQLKFGLELELEIRILGL